MKNPFFFKGNTDGQKWSKTLGLARYYGESDQVLLILIPFNWIVIAFDTSLFYVRRGRVLRCPHCKKAI